MITKRFLLLAAGVLLALAFASSCSSDVEDGSLKYGGQTYKIVIINGQQLMAENLNYDVPGSECYGNDPANCAKYGRLYDWSMAMALPISCNSLYCANRISAPHRGICPGGWHIPANAEWNALYSLYDSSAAGKNLKAKEGWNNCGPSDSGKPYSCEDTHGFAALPGGYGYPAGGGFNAAGEYGYWLSASEYDADASKAYGSYIYNRDENAYWGYNIKTYLFSVRCFKD